MPAHPFIQRWQNSAAAERANYQLFLSELCDYLDMLLVPAQQQEVGRALVEYLMAYGGEEWELCFHNLSQHSPTPALFHDRLVQHGVAVEVEQIETCPTAVLSTDWETYLATLRNKDRHELRRKLRRAAAAEC